MDASAHSFEEVLDEQAILRFCTIFGIPGSSRRGEKSASHRSRRKLILEGLLDDRAIPRTPIRFQDSEN